MTKKKPGKHLQFYMDCLELGEMPEEGLCLCVDEKQMGPLSSSIFNFFIPDEEERNVLQKEDISRAYWGSGLPDCNGHYYQFTPLRQTIVLFMAAIAGEL